jgi:hypothetical protein
MSIARSQELPRQWLIDGASSADCHTRNNQARAAETAAAAWLSCLI